VRIQACRLFFGKKTFVHAFCDLNTGPRIRKSHGNEGVKESWRMRQARNWSVRSIERAFGIGQ
jgi:hypothetical protein